jgi:hypothetical protein
LLARLLWVFGLLVFPIVGCTDVVEFRTYRISVTAFNPDGMDPLLEGVKICEADADPENCVTTNELGRADLDVRSNQEITITMDKEGYGPFVIGDVSDETFGPQGGTGPWPADWRMYTDAQLAAIAEQLQTPYPWEGGIVGLLKWLSPNTGVTFAPVGSTIDAVGEAFYFDAATEQYSLDLEATTPFHGLWNFPLAEGGFTEVTPGEQQFELGGTAADCPVVSWGWPVDDAPNRIRSPSERGTRPTAAWSVSSKQRRRPSALK